MDKIIDRHKAGRRHQVLTLNGSNKLFRRAPCATCPWRRDAIGEFPAEAFRHSACTGADGAHFSPEAMHTFACHESGSKKSAVCAGYILQNHAAIGWRIAVTRGEFDPKMVSADGLDLFDSYYEMAVANGVPADDPAIASCRPWRSGT